MPTLSESIQQKSFEEPRQQVLINIMFSSGWAKTGSTNALKPHALTWQQFNLMRILRGQGNTPVSMRLLSERMLDPQSNASRLVDKLVEKGLVTRETCPTDRRQVRVALTSDGRTVLAKASDDIKAYYLALGGDLSDEELVTLSDLLDRFRESRRH